MADKVKLAIKNIEKFNGSKDFEDWYRDFEATVDALFLEGADRYTALVLVLDQDVVTRIMAECKEAGSLPTKKEERTIEWLTAELRKRYAYDKTVLKRLQELLQRRKERDETLEGYMVAKRQLYLQWGELMKDTKNPNAAWSDSSRLFWEMAIDGMPKSLQPTVKTLHPADQERKFDELIKTVRSLQSSEPRPSTSEASKPASPLWKRRALEVEMSGLARGEGEV